MSSIKEELEYVKIENERLTELLHEKDKIIEQATKKIEALKKELEEERQGSNDNDFYGHICEETKGKTTANENFFRGASDEDSDDFEYIEESGDVMGELKNDLTKQNSGTSVETASGDEDDTQDFNELKHSLRRSNSLTPINDLMLACTLCGYKIKLEEIEKHSKVCSTNLDKQENNNLKAPTKPGLIVATITTSRRESLAPGNDPRGMFKVICKTTINTFKKTLLVSRRTLEEFDWFRTSLENFHPQSVIPPLKLIEGRQNETGNLREAQRFLSRVCAHYIFKNSPVTKYFFSASRKELQLFREYLENKVRPRLKPKKPAVEKVDKEGLIFRSQTYLSHLVFNLNGLIECIRGKKSERKPLNSLSQSFMALSQGERHITYLQCATQSLSDVLSELEDKGDDIYDDCVFSSDLESIVEYIKAALELLSRVESCINTYLYWEEEVRTLEQMKTEGLVTRTNENSIAKLWGEASANCRQAKTELESMGKRLSNELVYFDMRKEDELKHVFIEYAGTRFDVFETFQNKWAAMKIVLNSDIQPDIRGIDFASN